MNFKAYQILLFAVGVIALALLCIPPERERGIMLAQRQHNVAAIEVLRKILKEDPYDIGALKMIVPLLLYDKRGEEAAEHIKKYRRGHPHDGWAKKRLVFVYRQLFYLDKALAILNEDRHENYDTIFNILIELGRVDEAVDTLKEQMSAGDNDYQRWQTIQTYQRWSMNIPGMIEAIVKRIQLRNRAGDIAEIIAVLTWQGRDDEALPYAEMLLNHDERSADHERLLAAFYTRLRKIDRATVAVQSLCRRPESSAQDWQDCAYLLAWAKRDREALTMIDGALKKFGMREATLWMGYIFAKRIQLAERQIFYLQKLGEIKNDGILYLNVAGLLVEENRPEEARAVLMKIVSEKMPQELEASLQIVDLDLRQKQRHRALNSLQRVERRFMREHIGTEELLRLYLFYDRLIIPAERNALLRMAEKRNSTEAATILVDIYLERYWATYNSGDEEQRAIRRHRALHALTELKKSGISSRHHNHLVNLLIDEGDYSTAKKEYHLLSRSSIEIEIQLALMALDNNEIQFAEELVETIRAKDKRANIWELEAALAEKQGNLIVAIRSYRRQLQLQPDNTELTQRYYKLIKQIGGIVPRPITAQAITKEPPLPYDKMSRRDQLLEEAYRSDAGSWRDQQRGWFDTYTAYSRALRHSQRRYQ